MRARFVMMGAIVLVMAALLLGGPASRAGANSIRVVADLALNELSNGVNILVASGLRYSVDRLAHPYFDGPYTSPRHAPVATETPRKAYSFNWGLHLV